jgi:acetyl-CoA carboxylase carboxyl transferase subunit alpha
VSANPHLEFEKDIVEIQDEIQMLLDQASKKGIDVSDELTELRSKLERLKVETYRNLKPLEQVQVARHPRRPYTLDYLSRAFSDFIELHGDRSFRDDEAIVGGWARLEGRTVMVIGHQKGRDMKENLRRNFGMPHPEGYRKALRLMRLAEKFGRPVVTLIDTPGAYPGIGAEERGQAEAIARNLREMAILRTPLVSVIIGEGGSGGALALGVTDLTLMLEHSVYSVISPEGCAAILWRSSEYRESAAEALKLTSEDLLALGVCDEIIPEPAGGAHSDWDSTANSLRRALARRLDDLEALDMDDLIDRRHAKFEAVGSWNGESGSHIPAKPTDLASDGLEAAVGG